MRTAFSPLERERRVEAAMRRAAAHQRHEVDLHRGAAADADDDDAPTDGERRERRGQARGADELEDDVVGAVLGHVAGLDDLGRAERGDRLVLSGVAHGRDDASAGQRRQLHRGRADAAGRAGDEHAVAERQARLPEERVVGGRVHLHEAAGLRPAQAGGHPERVRLVHHGQLGLGAAADERHHPVADGEPGHARAHGGHLAGHLEARDVLRPPGRRRVPPGALREIGAVHAGRPDRHDDVVVAGLRVRAFPPAKLSFVDHDGVHGPPPPGAVIPTEDRTIRQAQACRSCGSSSFQRWGIHSGTVFWSVQPTRS